MLNKSQLVRLSCCISDEPDESISARARAGRQLDKQLNAPLFNLFEDQFRTFLLHQFNAQFDTALLRQLGGEVDD